MPRITLHPAGWQFDAGEGQTVLQAALAAGVRLPVSCRNGTCRTCMCRMTQGRVRYDIPWPGLSAEEKAEGCILPCVAYPESEVRIVAPGARRSA